MTPPFDSLKSSYRAKFKIARKNKNLYLPADRPCTVRVQPFLPVRQFGERAMNSGRSCGFGAGVLPVAQVSNRYE